jgi:hypothetical protein
MSFGLVLEMQCCESPSSLALARDPPSFEPIASSSRTLAGGRQRGFNDLGALR